MIRELDRMAEDWPGNKAEYLSTYRTLDITCGREVNVISGGKVRPASVLQINDDFSLKVNTPTERSAIFPAEKYPLN